MGRSDDKDASNETRSTGSEAELASTVLWRHVEGTVSGGAPPVARGEVVGGYTLQRRVGEGGMGQVWLALHHVHGRQAAVKLIFKNTYGDRDQGRIAHEFQLAVQMRHDNIVSVIDAGIHEHSEGCSLPYVIMEYLPAARPITTYAGEHDLDVRGRLELFSSRCAAVAYMHEHGHIHLDLKPDNILVDDAGKVFLTDFGIARPVLGWFLDRVAGTPGYMGPEHFAADAERIDKRTDVWSLGAVLYQLLTGTDPYGLPPDAPAAERREAMQHLPRPLRETAGALEEEAPELAGALESIVRRCLEPDPERRYRSAGDLADALRGALAARGPRWAFGRMRRERARTWATLVAAATILVATGLAALLTPRVLAVWTSPLTWYQSWLPAPRASLAALTSLPDVTIVDFDDATAEAVRGAPDLEGFRPTDRGSFRRMHAAAIPRLVEAGVRVIVFDVFFSSERAGLDVGLADAIRAARSRGCTVVIGVKSWHLDDHRPKMSRTIWESGPLWGGATVGGTGPHWATLLVEREGEAPMPSLSTAAFAAYRAPDSYHELVRIDDRIRVRPFRQDPRRPDARFYGDEFWIGPVGSRVFQPDLGSSAGLLSGDQEAFDVVELPSSSAFGVSTIRYEDLWSAPVDRLKRRLSGKIAFIADVKGDPPIRGTNTKAYRVQVATIQALILEYHSRLTTRWNLLLTILGAAIGVGVVSAGGRRRRGRPAAGVWRPVARGIGLALLVAAGVACAAVVLLAIAWLARLVLALWLFPMPGVVAAALAAVATAVWGGAYRIGRRPAGAGPA